MTFFVFLPAGTNHWIDLGQISHVVADRRSRTAKFDRNRLNLGISARKNPKIAFSTSLTDMTEIYKVYVQL